MVDVAVRTRKQGLDEQLTQKQADARDRTIARQEKKLHLMAIRNAYYGLENNKPLANGIIYNNENEQKREELKLQQQIGLPEREHKEDTLDKLQVRTDFPFRVPQRDSMARMGYEQENLEIARKEHGFEPNERDKNERAIEAANNPTPKKKDDLNKNLQKEEKEFKKRMEKFHSDLSEKEKETEWTIGSRQIIHSDLSYKEMRDKLRELAFKIRKAASGQKVLGGKKHLPAKNQKKRVDKLLNKTKEKDFIKEYLRRTRAIGKGI